MNKLFKKITSLVIALVMIITPAVLFYVPNMTAAAEGVHSHKVCGGLAHEGCTHGDIEFEPYPSDGGAILRGKNYYLTKDIVLGENQRIFVEKGVTNICLNGHSIKKEYGQIIDINNIDGQTAELNICDCTGKGRIENISETSGYACINVIDDSTLNIYGGTIDGGAQGSGIDVESSTGTITRGGSVNIYGGVISSDNNACVYVSHVTDCGCWNFEEESCQYSSIANSLSIYGGEMRSNGYYTIFALGKGSTVSIYRGKIIQNDDYYDALAIKGDGASATISGGQVISENSDGVYCWKGALKVNGGSINSVTGTAIYNSEDCHVQIGGGTISSGNKDKSTIRNYGAFEISNGNIDSDSAYAIQNYENANLKISGGTVNGSGYALYNRDGGLTDINGGSLTTTYDNYCIWNNGTLNISGGEIKASYSPVVNHGTLNISGGEIKASYSPVENHETLNISGGSFGAEDSSNPTFIINDKQLNLSGSPLFNNASIWLKSDDNIGITGELTYSAPALVYIESTTPRVFTSGWSSYMSSNAPSNYFKSPYSACTVAKSGGEAVLRCFTLTFDANGGTCNTSDTIVNDELKASVLPEASREGYSFDGWFTTKDGGDKITADTVFNSDATLYAHWTQTHVHNWQDTEIIKAPGCIEGGQTLQTCTSCGKTRTINTSSLGGHTFPDTWEYNENSHYHICTVCRKGFKDIEAHKYSDNYQKDANTHWKICEICNAESSKETHTWNKGVVITPPTSDMEGRTKYTCTVCKAEKEENIPATGEDNTDEPATSDKGNIIKDVSLSVNVPNTTLTTPLKELIASVLTHEEQEVINSGIDIKIMLTVDDATNNVSPQDKTAVENRLGGLKDYKLGQYLDVNLLKIIGGSEGVKITQTNKPITVTFEIPDALQGKVRYSVIRIHQDKADVLQDLDNAPNTITIETDKFSTYALVYQEETPSDNTSDNSSSNSPTSGTNSAVDESNRTPDDSGTSDINDNPPTGAAVSIIPLVAILSGVTFVINRKKK